MAVPLEAFVMCVFK
ncbi:DUF1196 domain-containing protein [Vibrio cholerae]|nr:DUF1196 domain-containing protein [Vibrio cholerae]TYW32410.1 DUF1196 domain-containing protein [Vibrio cholerae]